MATLTTEKGELKTRLDSSIDENKSGNYGGLFGKITNFKWTFNPDGSYDITITVVSLGDVIESLKANITPNLTVS